MAKHIDKAEDNLATFPSANGEPTPSQTKKMFKCEIREQSLTHSDRSGNCECCDKPGDLYILSIKKWVTTSFGRSFYTTKPSVFGHRKCLLKQINFLNGETKDIGSQRMFKR